MSTTAIAERPTTGQAGAAVRQWKPFPRQALFLRCPADEALFGGSKGPGKTDALLAASIAQVHIPEYRALIVRRTFPKLQEIIDRSQRWFAGQAHFNAQQRRWVFPSGAMLSFGHCQSEADKYNYQGHEYQFIGFDQLEEFTETQYLFIIAQCRSSVATIRKYIRSTSNPGNVGHAWVKRRFIDPLSPHGHIKYFKRVDDDDIECPASDPDAMSRAFIASKMHDNPALTINDPQYVARLRQLPQILQQAFIDGDYDVFAGQFFAMWRRHIHVVPRVPAEMTTPVTRFLAMDYGYRKPSCVLWFMVLPSRRLVVYRELYREGRTYEQLARDILELSPASESYAYIVADPAIWGDRQHHFSETHAQEARGESGALTMQQIFGQRLALVQADNRRVAGWNRVREFLEQQTDADGQQFANLVVTENCVNTIRTVPGLVHSETKPEDCDSDGEDHAGDTVRYGVMTMHDVPDLPAPPKTPAGQFWDLVREDQRRHGRAHMIEAVPDELNDAEPIGEGEEFL